MMAGEWINAIIAEGTGVVDGSNFEHDDFLLLNNLNKDIIGRLTSITVNNNNKFTPSHLDGLMASLLMSDAKNLKVFSVTGLNQGVRLFRDEAGWKSHHTQKLMFCGELTEINLAKNNIADMANFDQLLVFQPALTTLNLSGNQINDKGVEILVKNLSEHPALTDLNLSDNKNITDKSADLLIEALKKNTTVQRIDLLGTEISEDKQREINQYLQRNINLPKQKKFEKELAAYNSLASLSSTFDTSTSTTAARATTTAATTTASSSSSSSRIMVHGGPGGASGQVAKIAKATQKQQLEKEDDKVFGSALKISNKDL